jgi:hypothetical protein
MKWMRAWRHNEELWRKGGLWQGKASVIFKVPNKAAGQKLLKEIWVAGNRFQAEQYVPSKADSLCAICNMGATQNSGATAASQRAESAQVHTERKNTDVKLGPAER